MKISIVDFVAGAERARGLVIVIDVFRAFSVAAYAFARGAAGVIPVAAIETARQLKAEDPTRILLGERHAKPLPGFDCGNSPTELEHLEVTDRWLVHTTHSGTQGLTGANAADEVLTGALVNAGAIARYVRARNPAEVTLVRMGHEARERCDEDDACAELLAARLRGETPPIDGLRAKLRNAPSAKKFFDPACDWAPERDFELCTDVDRFDFVLRLDRSLKPAVLRKVLVSA
jgi:2-phosphosulfolactate phosphatase